MVDLGVRPLLALTDDEVAEQTKVAEARLDELHEALYARPPEPAPEPVAPPEPLDEPIPLATGRVAPPERIPMVLDIGGRYEEERGWHSLGDDIPRRRS